MDFFDKLGKRLAEAGRDMADKTKELTDTAKVKLDMKNKEDYIEAQYTAIGKQFFEAHQFEDSDEYPQIAMIKAAMDELDELRTQLMSIKGAKECPKCHQMVPADAEFCSFCGEKLTVEGAWGQENSSFTGTFNNEAAADATVDPAADTTTDFAAADQEAAPTEEKTVDFGTTDFGTAQYNTPDSSAAENQTAAPAEDIYKTPTVDITKKPEE